MSQYLWAYRADDQPSNTERHAECLGSDNASDVTVSESDSESASDVAKPCAGCGRRFVPTGPQRYCSHECYSETLRGPIEPRFWSKVNKAGPVQSHQAQLGQCWTWTRSQARFGYGQFTYRLSPGGAQVHIYAHRFAWQLTHGDIPTGLQVCHRCDNPSCVRPSHLFLGTQQDNIDDARRKGRIDLSRPRRRRSA